MKGNEFLRRKVAVTGATGMVGSHLVAELVRAGYGDITLVVRNASRLSNMYRTFGYMGVEAPDGVIKVVETELTDTDALAKAFEGVDTVFHCAAVIMTGTLDEQGLIDNNVSLARSVADAAIKSGVRKILQTSSIAVLAPVDVSGHTTITEDHTPFADKDCSAYAQSKFYSDNEMRRAEAAGIGLVILYPAVVIGEGDWSMNGSSAMIPIICKGIPVYAEGIMAYVDVRDLARAYVALDATPEAVGKSFIISGDNLSYRRLIEYGAKAAGKPRPFIKVGKAGIMTAYGALRAVTWLGIMKDRSITRKNLDSVLYGNSYVSSRVQEMCNFEYTPMEETIGRVVNSYLAEKKEGKRNKKPKDVS